jgi:hypothetical protein
MTCARASYWGSAVNFGFREAPTRCFEERLDQSPAVSIFKGTGSFAFDYVGAANLCAAVRCLAVARHRAAGEHIHDAM